MEKDTITIESYITSICGAKQGEQYVGRIIQERDKLIEALNAFKGNAKNVKILKGDIAEHWIAGTFNIDAARKGSADRATAPRSTELGSPDIVLNSGKKVQVKYYKNGKASAEEQAKSWDQAAHDPNTQSGATKKIDSGEVNPKDPVYKGDTRVVPTDQLKDAKEEMEKKIAKESTNRPEEAKRYQDTLDNLTDVVENDEGVSSTPLSEKDARDIAEEAKQGEVTPGSVDLTDKDIIKLNYVVKNAVKAGLQSAAIAAGISMVLSLASKYIKEGKAFWDYEAEDWKDIFGDAAFSAISGGVSAGVLYMVGSYSAGAVPGVSALLMATFGIASMVPDYLDGKMSKEEFIVEAEMVCFDAAIIVLTGVVSQMLIPGPILGAVIGAVAGMIAVSIIQDLWGDELREFLAEMNRHIENLFDRIKEFFVEIWEKLKAKMDFWAYLSDDDFNHALERRYKSQLLTGGDAGDYMAERTEFVLIERRKCYE